MGILSKWLGKTPDSPSRPKTFKEVTPKWKAGAFLICDKCGNKLATDGAPNPAGELRTWLKAELKSKGAWGKVRVMGSSCLDICPKGAVTIGVLSDLPGEPAKCWIIDPTKNRDEILNEILSYGSRAPS